ncbi:MAG TPA: creatininase family protein [Anaerolineae bacterium]
MRLEEMNWMDVEAYLKKDDRLMLVAGACEQHGYLSLLTDVKIPLRLADEASARTGVLVAPALNFGVSPYFTRFPGTITLRTQTFLSVIGDLVRGVYAQGFRRLLFVNGHGGNDSARGVLHELANELPELKVGWYSWWAAPSVTEVAASAGLRSYHAAWIEAFPFCRVCEMPKGEKQPVGSQLLLNAADERALIGDGVYGGPYVADDALMQRIFNAALEDIVARLQFEN